MSDTTSNPEQALMVTTRRWLYNNDIQMSLRQLSFNVNALEAAAAKAAGASKCNEIEVIAEGTFNRVFRLGLSDGKDVIARIPFPNAGPRSLLTRSEVATMDFVRSRLGAPVPKVLAWEATSDNDVGCEYIIMEKCDGSALEERLDPNSEQDFRYVYDMAELMSGLASVPFSQYGSIYYKEDVDSHLRKRPLYAEGQEQDESSERFRIGPTVERRFYRGERTHMSIDRGPWRDIKSYIEAAVRCEIEWIQSHSSSPRAQKQLGAQHSAEQHISLLQKWLALAPAVLPAPEYCAPTLSHPDLHAENILVTDKDPISVAWILDWQGAAVCPLFETELPKFLPVNVSNLEYVKVLPNDLQQPVLPDNYQELTVDEQEEARAEFKQVWPKHAFFKVVGQLRHPLLVVHRLIKMELLRRAIHYSSHSWSDGLPPFERCLTALSAKYGNNIPVHDDYPVCPVVFSEDDIKRNEEEYQELVFKEEWLDAQMRRMMEQDGILIQPDGSVDPETFEAAVKMVEELFESATAGQSEEQVEKIRRNWPMREGKFVLSMESCI